MINRMLATIKPLMLGVFAISMIAFAQSVARADEVTVAGNTAGCFGAGCTPGASSTILGLTYNNSTFSGTTSGGFLAIGNTAGSPNVDNLGSFTLTGQPANYNGQSFTLQVTFTLPSGITGGNPATYTATLFGTVTSVDTGGVFIDFNNTPQTFTFSNGTSSGSFSLSVNDVSVIPGGTIALSGNIMGAQQQNPIPEPATLILLGTGLSGVAAGIRRRRRNAQNN